MTKSADVITPSFSREVVESLPLYYRAMAEHLADTGRAVITGSLEKSAEKANS